ncbi:hypothetical protein PRIPAC_92165, partial [Pristionchus pacificus]|uniref:Uncharacterized protein n=1 Tax=Pristionchus pacificus TaxID=54126 RepID=A0A2A6CDH9_PRIPA
SSGQSGPQSICSREMILEDETNNVLGKREERELKSSAVGRLHKRLEISHLGAKRPLGRKEKRMNETRTMEDLCSAVGRSSGHSDSQSICSREMILEDETVNVLGKGEDGELKSGRLLIFSRWSLIFNPGMKTGADPLREITFSDVPAAVALAALDTLGLYLPPETHIHSRIRNVEVYLWNEDFFIIFDDRIITIQACILIRNEPGLFCIERCEVDGSRTDRQTDKQTDKRTDRQKF